MQSFFGNIGGSNQMLTTILIYAVIFGGMYFFLFRPQSKKAKKEAEMRNNLQIGDEVVTVGGIIGKIISIKEDSIVIESGSDKIRFKRWAVSGSNTTKETV